MENRSPSFWLNSLYRRLFVGSPQVRTFEDYYDGRHPLSFTSQPYREEFTQMLKGVSDNWMALVVDAVVAADLVDDRPVATNRGPTEVEADLHPSPLSFTPP